jgi:uncharacterized protein
MHRHPIFQDLEWPTVTTEARFEDPCLPPGLLGASDFHLFETEDGPHLLVVDGSQIFKIDCELQHRLEAASRAGGELSRAILSEYGIGDTRYINPTSVVDPPVRALSLTVSGKCNLGCTYCYAEGGSFGRTAHNMSWSVAAASVDRLLANAKVGERVNLAFLGGEPLVNRELIRRTTEFAVSAATKRGILIGFSITTNGTLLNVDDAEFFERHGFAVTVSLDGIGETHDRLRPSKNGRGTYDRVIANVKQLLSRQQRMQVSARVTVTPENLGLRLFLDHLIDLGFHSVGFSPMLSAPSARGEMQSADLAVLLDEMIACGREFERRVMAGERYPFANLMTAIGEIYRGTHRPYPCGAGAGYLGVSATGGLFACHRFVEDDRASMGTIAIGVDRARQQRWLAERMVDRQEPCRSCWARYLCGGGCHYEVIHRGRPACDYIRGWLEYALGVYIRVITKRPDAIMKVVSQKALREVPQPSHGSMPI